MASRMFISAPPGKAAPLGKVCVPGPSDSGEGRDERGSCRPGFLKVMLLALFLVDMLTFGSKVVLVFTERDQQINI